MELCFIDFKRNGREANLKIILMEIKQTDDGKKGYFKAIESGLEAGIMTYTWAGETKFIIDHTVVAPLFEGKGIGKKLVMAAVYFARQKHLKIMPLCTYTKSVFDKNAEELKDVLF